MLGPAVSHKKLFPAEARIACQNVFRSNPDRFATKKNNSVFKIAFIRSTTSKINSISLEKKQKMSCFPNAKKAEV